jgi:hypothetical protein
MLKTLPLSIRLSWQVRLSEQQLQPEPVLVQVLRPWAQEQLLQGPVLPRARVSAQQLLQGPVLQQARLSVPEQRRALLAPSFLQTNAAGDTPERIPEAQL